MSVARVLVMLRLGAQVGQRRMYLLANFAIV
jgi:hypothetical protein